MTLLSLRWARAAMVWIGCGLGASALVTALQSELSTLARTGLGAPPADLLVAASAGALVVCAAWLWAVVTAHLLSVVRGRPTHWLGAPASVRRLVVVACGVLAVGMPGLAQAAPTTDTPDSPASPSLQGLSLPDLPDTEMSSPDADPTERARPEEPDAPAPTAPEATTPTPAGTPGADAPVAPTAPDDVPPGPRPSTRTAPTPRSSATDTESYPPNSSAPQGPTASHPAAPDDVVVVAPEDTLWSIAAAHVPAGSDDATIDRAWREIWHTNRDVIGNDPDLIRPGQRLVVRESQ